MITKLNVPYSEKDQAKAFGARWNGIEKTWYVENVENLEPFLRWMPRHLIKPVKSEGKKSKVRKSKVKRPVFSTRTTVGSNYIPVTFVDDSLPWL